MKKILCVLPKITGGGAERFLITFLRQLNQFKHSPYEVVLVLARRGGAFEHEIPANIPIYVLNEQNYSPKLLAPFGPIRYVFALSKLINEIKTDAILSFGSLLNGSVALAAHYSKQSNPVVVIEAIHQSSEISKHRWLEKWSRTLFLRWTYSLASRIVAVSEDVASDLKDNFGISRNVNTIHYGVDVKHIRNLASEPIEHPWLSDSRQDKTIVTCGRLVAQKGFDVLLNSMCSITDNVKLILIGDGEERPILESKIKQLKLQDRVDLVGYDRNPYKYMSKANLFVLPSLWEGLPIILLEAIALGLPIVASDCPTGPQIILNNGQCGILVSPGDPHALALSINKLIFNEEQKQELRANALRRSEDFSAQKSINKYLELLSTLSNQ